MSRKRKKPKTVSLAPIGRASGNFDLGLVDVQDPFEPGQTIRVVKNNAVTPIDHLRARGALTLDQKAAGDRFMALYEAAEIGGARAIDYSRVKVDVSFEHKGLDPRVGEAIDELEAIRAIVGRRSYQLLWDVIGNRQSPHLIAARIDNASIASQRTRKFVITALCFALDDLIEHFDVVAKGRKRRAA
jgi:hypothetical protein